MTDRSANHKIQGYYYQFNKTIFDLLCQSNDNNSIIVEGIEDFDIKTVDGITEAVQCKYYAKYNKAIIREAIEHMVLHYKQNKGKNFKYRIYIYFNEFPEDLKSINLNNLKDFLTKNKGRKNEEKFYAKNNVSDKELTNFLKIFYITAGDLFEELEKKLIDKIKNIFNCSNDEALYYHYNYSLRIILDLARKSSVNDRTISKKNFINEIKNKKELLYNIWFIERIGHKKYVDFLKKKIQKADGLKNTKDKYLVIDNDEIDCGCDEFAIIPFIKKLVDKTFKLPTAKPFLIIIKDHNLLLQIKKDLINENIQFNDGYEQISFNAEILNKTPLIYKNSASSKIKEASYVLKIIGLDTYKNSANQITVPHVLFWASKQKCDEKFCKNYAKQFFQLPCTSLLEIVEVLGV